MARLEDCHDSFSRLRYCADGQDRKSLGLSADGPRAGCAGDNEVPRLRIFKAFVDYHLVFVALFLSLHSYSDRCNTIALLC